MSDIKHSGRRRITSIYQFELRYVGDESRDVIRVERSHCRIGWGLRQKESALSARCRFVGRTGGRNVSVGCVGP